MDDTLAQLGGIWGSWSTGRKMFVTLASVASIGGLIALLSSPDSLQYSPLMTNLSLDDANTITESLTTMQVPHKLSGSGSTIMVPKDRVHELRMKLAGQGLPKGGGVGFELFDDPALGMSRFAENLNYRRGLQGELQRTISSIDVVKNARVHLVLPKKRLFKDKDEPARASVTLRLVRGRALTDEQVQGVVHLVASAVEGLSPQYVTVVDANGKMLAKGGGDNLELASGMEQQRKLEESLENRVSRIMERVVGEGKASVQVSVEMDFSQNEYVKEEFDPELVAVRSEQTSTEERGSAEKTAAGIPGARANMAGGVGGVGAGAESSGDSRKAETRNYEISKTTTRQVAKIARLKRVTVAVVVDKVRMPSADGKTETVEERPAEEMQQLTELVQKAVGYDAKRGDEISVMAMAFTRTEAEEELKIETGMTGMDWFHLLWRPIIGLFLLILLFMVIRSLGRAADAPPVPILETPRSVRDLEAALSSGAAQSEALAASTEAQAVAGAMKGGRPDPEKAAAVIKGWLSEG
ncbi:MAG: flagellar basal-body MS-ring/collar protein FliF [Myxococcota bacterium]|nr:flagellar basal-body MS-ring/collar protein FliF [Myxococcota bacterium]